MIATVQDRVEFQNLGEQWNALASRFQTPLLRHEWFAACVEGFCPPDKLALFVLSDRHDVSAIAPFALVQTAAGERLEFLGATILGEPSGFLYRDEDSLQALLKAVFLLEKPILVARVPEQSLEARHMDTMLRGARGFTVKRSSGSPWIPLNGTWGEFEGRMSSSRRSSLRRLRRRAESLGRVDFDFRTPSSNEVGGLLEDFFAVEASSWKGTLGTAVQQDPRTKRFFTTYAEAEARQGMLRLAFLRIDGQPIAALVAVESENR
ncbi:MAG: GNAT family N-acetyltransferase, partial [Bacteroidota bacterium]